MEQPGRGMEGTQDGPPLALERVGGQTARGLQMSHLTHEILQPVVVGPAPLDIGTFIGVAMHGVKVKLSDDPAWLRKMAACEITLSALTAEALQASMPVASFSRSTESHNQDKVSMGTIAAPEALRVCELVGHAVAVHLLAAAQACELRGGLPGRPAIAAAVAVIRGLSPALADDRPLDRDIEAVYEAVATGALGQPLPVEG